MAKHSFLIESNIQAKDIDALNKYAVATVDVDGGTLVQLAPPNKKGNDVWTATVPSDSNLSDLWIAYNPSEKYIGIGDKTYAGIALTADIRDFTNVKNHTFTAFQPQIGDEIDIPVYAITGGSSLVATDYIEAVADDGKFTRVAHATGATEGSMAFRVDYVWNESFPKAGIGEEKEKMAHAVRVQ